MDRQGVSRIVFILAAAEQRIFCPSRLCPKRDAHKVFSVYNFSNVSKSFLMNEHRISDDI